MEDVFYYLLRVEKIWIRYFYGLANKVVIYGNAFVLCINIKYYFYESLIEVTTAR